MRTLPGSNPGFTPTCLPKLLMRSPAPTSSVSASATSATMSARRILRPPPSVPERPPSFSASCRWYREPCSAGAMPKRIPQKTDRQRVKATTVTFTPISSARGSWLRATTRRPSTPRLATRDPERAAGECEDHALHEDRPRERPAIAAYEEGRLDLLVGEARKRVDLQRPAGLRHVVGELFLQPVPEARHLVLRLLRRNPRPEPGDEVQVLAVVLRALEVRVRERKRQPHLRPIDPERAEALRHHADDGVGAPVELQRLSQHVGGSSEQPVPDRVGDDGDVLSRHVVVALDPSADRRGNPEHVEPVSAHAGRRDPFRITGTGEVSPRWRTRPPPPRSSASCRDSRDIRGPKPEPRAARATGSSDGW